MDDEREILAVEVTGKNAKHKCEIIGIYRAANGDTMAVERLISHISLMRNLARRSIIGGDLNLPDANWAGDAGKENGFQMLVNKLICENGYTQVVSEPTRGDALLAISCNVQPGISDHKGVLLEVEWRDNNG